MNDPGAPDAKVPREFQMVHLLGGLFGVFFLVAGAFSFWYCSAGLEEAFRSQQWPSVRGHIVSSQLGEVVCGVNGNGCPYPVVSYSYSVAGATLQGSRTDIIMYGSNGSYARDAVAAFPEGADVPVYYDPEIPSRSVLRPGPNGFAFVMIPLSLAFMAVGGWLLSAVWQRKLAA